MDTVKSGGLRVDLFRALHASKVRGRLQAPPHIPAASKTATRATGANYYSAKPKTAQQLTSCLPSCLDIRQQPDAGQLPVFFTPPAPTPAPSKSNNIAHHLASAMRRLPGLLRSSHPEELPISTAPPPTPVATNTATTATPQPKTPKPSRKDASMQLPTFSTPPPIPASLPTTTSVGKSSIGRHLSSAMRKLPGMFWASSTEQLIPITTAPPTFQPWRAADVPPPAVQPPLPWQPLPAAQNQAAAGERSCKPEPRPQSCFQPSNTACFPLQAPPLQALSVQAPPLRAPSFQAPHLQAPPLLAPSFQAPPLQAPSLRAPSVQARTCQPRRRRRQRLAARATAVSSTTRLLFRALLSRS